MRTTATVAFYPALNCYLITYDLVKCACEDTYEQAILVKRLIEGTL